MKIQPYSILCQELCVILFLPRILYLYKVLEKESLIVEGHHQETAWENPSATEQRKASQTGTNMTQIN